ncbi:MAG: peptidoglycan editing factor PgeF [bacterium]
MDNGWEVRKIGPLNYLVMPAFESVLHGVTTKEIGEFNSDNPEKIKTRLNELFGINQIAWTTQLHGDEIYVIGENNFNQFVEENLPEQVQPFNSVNPNSGNELIEADGLMTNIPGICLTIRIADCLPIFILDKKNKAIGLVHAGWRGTVKCIVQKAILKMITLYGSSPEDFIVGFGPSIGVCCYKVGNDVTELIKDKDLVKDGYLNLQKVNKKQLLELGINNIILNQYCTYDERDLFFSHRRGDKGRMIAFLQMGVME